MTMSVVVVVVAVVVVVVVVAVVVVVIVVVAPELCVRYSEPSLWNRGVRIPRRAKITLQLED
jgi:hypothetical protein